jgi:hypothetical protein
MNSTIRAIAVLFLCLGTASVAATEVDFMDHVLIAYGISEDQENAFSGADGITSEFWDAIMADEKSEFDHVYLLPEVHGIRAQSPHGDGPQGDPFSDGNDDAQMWTYAAWGQKGLYLLIEVLDDAFVGVVGNFDPLASVSDANYHWTADYWMNDCVDLFFDIYPSEELKNKWVECVTNQITNTTWQYQYRFGIADAPTTMCVNYPSPGGIDRWNPECNPDGKDMGELNLTPVSVTEAGQNYGVIVEIIQTGENKKAQEWFFPWSHVAAGLTMPAKGARIAFSVQYNDMDPNMAGNQTLPDVLFMVNAGNPFWGRDISENWGDIEFGGSVDEIAGPQTAVVSHPVFEGPRTSGAGLFTINGRSVGLSEHSAQSVSMVLLEKIKNEKGAAVVRKALLRK